MAKNELEHALPIAASFQDMVIAGDTSGAAVEAARLSEHATAAASLTNDSVWRAFEFVPLIGPNLTAFRELAAVIETVSVDAVEPLAEVVGGFNLAAVRPLDGTIGLQPLLDSRIHLESADAALLKAQSQTQAVDTSNTVGQISTAAKQLSDLVDKAAEGVGAAKRAVTLLPAMLGDDGPRKYILLFQNNAELRATGGLPGAMALLETSGGRLGLTSQVTGGSFEPFESPVLDLPVETRGIYTDRVSTYMGDVTLTPHFPTTAAVVREMWRLKHGDEVDGVISIDPVALSYLLRATGPIALETGEVITSENAVQLLLTDVYTKYEISSEQDAFFAATAAAVFGAIANGQGDPSAMISALAQAGGERRILIWSAHEDDQQVLAGTTLAGELPVSDASGERFGIYLNDATGAKMDTYLDVQMGLGEVTCRADGRPYYSAVVTLTNTAPADAADALPESITGPGTFGVQQGNIKTLIAIYAPKTAQILGMAQNDQSVPFHPATDSGHPVSQIGVELAPGESMTTRAYFLGASAAHSELMAETTPLVRPNPVQVAEVSCSEVPQ